MELSFRKTLLKGDKPNLQSSAFYSVTAIVKNPNNTNRQRKFVFVLNFDMADCCDYFEAETTTAKERAEYFEDMVYNYIGDFDYFDEDYIKELAQKCKDSRDYYNKNIYPKDYIWV